MDDAKTENIALERMRIRYTFFKFVFGTVMLGLLSMGINWQIQQKRLEFEIRSKESDFVGQFLERALDRELEKRRDFAMYFRELSPSDEARKRWENYLSFVEERMKLASAKEDELKKKGREISELEEKLARAQAVAIEAETKFREVSEAVQKGDRERTELESQLSKLKAASSNAEAIFGKYNQLQQEFRTEKKELALLRSEPIEFEKPLHIAAANTATRSRNLPDFWDWTVFIKAADSVLNEIKEVEYTLHPTFPDPVRVVQERGTPLRAFPLSTSGWGTFPVKIRVFFKNGDVRELTHYLSFAGAN